uniref:Phlebovirus_G2 domain-containing protein n=1 Tax=Heterorhabditis bacteriophora TaxID=37862 RepID=A0A1I7XAH8_HETBA
MTSNTISNEKFTSSLVPGGNDIFDGMVIAIITAEQSTTPPKKWFMTNSQYMTSALDEFEEDATHLLQYGALKCDKEGNQLLHSLSPKTLPNSEDGVTYSIINERISATALEGATTLQIKFKHMKASARIDLSKCTLESANATGCYACGAGAQLEYICTTEFGIQKAHVECNTITFESICTSERTVRSTQIYTQKSNLDKQCTIRCSSSTTTGHLYGTLYFIETTNKWTKRKAPKQTEILKGHSISETILSSIQDLFIHYDNKCLHYYICYSHSTCPDHPCRTKVLIMHNGGNLTMMGASSLSVNATLLYETVKTN